jgi:hypothetical protein
VAGMLRKAPPAEARWILSNRPFPWGQAPAVQKVGTAFARKTTSRAREKAKSAAAFRGLVVSPLLFLVTSQHNIPHTSLDTGGGYRDLLHFRPREARRRSTPSPAKGGAAEVFFNSRLVLEIHGGGLNYHWYITMPSGSFCPYNCLLVLSVDLADPHCRSISLGWLDEPDPLGSSTSCCDSGLDPPPPQKSSHAHIVFTSELWSHASTR